VSELPPIVIDYELCTGHGRCVELCPEVFEFNADDQSQVRADAQFPERAALERVMSLCPELAISFADEG
jgi:ferredoxin